MNLKKFFSCRTIRTPLAATTKEGVLREMTELLCDAGKIDAACVDDAVQRLLRRERMMSTGIQDGLAIPHAKTRGVTGLVAAIGVTPKGIAFDALDGKPSQIFVVTLSPMNEPVPHVQFLAELCKLLHDQSIRDGIIAAATPDDVFQILFH